MTRLTIVLKSGRAFTVEVKDADVFYRSLKADGEKANAKGARDTVVIDGPIWLMIGEVAAIHPAEWTS
jgi:hypothetical protein